MARRHDRRGGGSPPPWESERTMAAAEQEAAEAAASTGAPASAAVTSCACGSHEFVLEAYLHVVDGQPSPEPVEVEALTCPACGREYEAIVGEGGRILRGDFLGYVDADE